MLNLHGDKPKFLAPGFGADIASQRADDLDLMAIAQITDAFGEGRKLSALDLACGAGGQTLRMAQAGAKVMAVDIVDTASQLYKSAMSLFLKGSVLFIKADMRKSTLLILGTFDVIVCQRAIHYLPYEEALDSVHRMKEVLAQGGRLYMSASGIESELGSRYPGKSFPLARRYAPLSEEMAEKHGIHGPVCLYSEEDMAHLLTQAGLAIEKIYSSPFGNVKAVARHDV